MTSTMSEVLEFAKTNDVKFIRLAFCDLLGVQKNIAIMPDQLELAFEDGISFDASSIEGFADIEHSDLLLFPDPATLSVLPWRPQQGRVARFFCDIKYADKTTFVCDTRALLKRAVQRAESLGYICNIGAECEFYLYLTDESGDPLDMTHDKGGYLDAAPLDKGENIRREICLALEEMGIKPEASHHEQGPGQHEIDFQYSDVLSAADNFISFKSVVKAIAARNGLFASFMPKPIKDKSGNGLHINISLSKNGVNIFKNSEAQHAEEARGFIAGVLDKVAEMALFLNPIVNSYKRLGAFSAPAYVSWSHQNRSQLIRIPAAVGEKTRFELRSPDPTVNPYLAFALVLHAGLDGIEHGTPLPPPLEINIYKAEEAVLRQLSRLPGSLDEAIALAKQSEFIRKRVDGEILNRYFAIKELEASAYTLSESKDEFDRKRYFERV